MATGRHLDFWPGDLWVAYAVAGAVSGLVGLADILTRYKDNPLVALWTRAAGVYIAANVVFGVVAFWLAVVLGLSTAVGLPDGEGGLTIEAVKAGLLVDFGAIIILRGVAFKLSVGGKSNDVGPSTIIDSLIATFDQSIDRTVAAKKDRDVRKMMSNVSFEKAREFIPTYCLSLLEQDEALAKRVGAQVATIGEFKKVDPTADSQRAFLLGNSLINIFGYSIAAAAVDGFRQQLAPDPTPNPRAQAATANAPPVAAAGGPSPAGAAPLPHVANPAPPAV